MRKKKTLEKLVGQLEELTDKTKIENKLQEIGAVLLTQYEIHAGSITIKPLVVEAYYYHPGVFEDNACHSAPEKGESNTAKLARKRQKNHQGELYVQYGPSHRIGIDICCSDSEKYYLSYLIKCATIHYEAIHGYCCCNQTEIEEQLCDDCTDKTQCNGGFRCRYYSQRVLIPKQNRLNNGKIVYLPRKGVGGTKFDNMRLAAVLLTKDTPEFSLTLEKGEKCCRLQTWRQAITNLAFKTTGCAATPKNARFIALAKEDWDYSASWQSLT